MVKVEPTAVHLQDGRVIPYGLCVWSTGVAPRSIIKSLDSGVFAKDKGDRLMTDGCLRALSSAGSGTWHPFCLATHGGARLYQDFSTQSVTLLLVLAGARGALAFVEFLSEI